MKKVTKDIDTVSLKAKQALLQELNQADLLDLFKKGYKSSYKPIQVKKVNLDQQIAISIGRDEKDLFNQELLEVKKHSGISSVSALIRSKSTAEIDIIEWERRAKEGLALLTSEEYDEKTLKKEKNRYMKLIDDLDINSDDYKESDYFFKGKLREIEDKLSMIGKIKPNRKFRINGRVTFNEANLIRWRAAKLSLPVSEYMRLLIFDYLPFSDADKHFSIDDRKRFYISILDVAKNGWGNVPVINECPSCARLMNDIKILKEQLSRFKQYGNFK